jgi:dihydropteroate synthase
MGILNVTPDSFSDGGSYADPRAATDRASAMVEAGAAIIDIGGESTRPGADRVSAAAQMDRVIPVVEAIRGRCDVALSIDTTRAAVAAAALDAGADIINDVSAGLEDEAMFPLAAARGCGLVLMHRLCPPDQDSWSTAYEAPPEYGGQVVAVVRAWLLERAARAEGLGVAADSICLDPGLGFGKSVSQNWQLIAGGKALLAAGYPVLTGASRKSFVGAVAGIDEPADRDAASAVAAAVQAAAGVQVLRAHDVAATVAAAALASGGERS